MGPGCAKSQGAWAAYPQPTGCHPGEKCLCHLPHQSYELPAKLAWPPPHSLKPRRLSFPVSVIKKGRAAPLHSAVLGTPLSPTECLLGCATRCEVPWPAAGGAWGGGSRTQSLALGPRPTAIPRPTHAARPGVGEGPQALGHPQGRKSPRSEALVHPEPWPSLPGRTVGQCWPKTQIKLRKTWALTGEV